MGARTCLELAAVLLLGCAVAEDDRDGDGVTDSLDCEPDDSDIHPWMYDPPDDGHDSNCDGTDGVDVDGDGWPARDDGADFDPDATDCDDEDPSRHPDALELSLDGIDSNCDDSDLNIVNTIELFEAGDIPLTPEGLPTTPDLWLDPSTYTDAGPLPAVWETLELHGDLGDIGSTWAEGDRDAALFEVGSHDSLLQVELVWQGDGINLDLLLYCFLGGEWRPPFHTPRLIDQSRPEEALVLEALPANSDCALLIVGQSGVSTQYSVHLSPLPSG